MSTLPVVSQSNDVAEQHASEIPCSGLEDFDQMEKRLNHFFGGLGCFHGFCGLRLDPQRIL